MSAASRTDSAQPEKSIKRKRSRDESDSNNEENRKRGRPRLDTQDESAADRRRTQIRHAQRAYRQRKENTIDELRKQVQDLQSTIQSMNQTFNHFSTKCSASNIPPGLLADLQNMTRLYSTGQRHADSSSSIESPEMAPCTPKTNIGRDVKDKDVLNATGPNNCSFQSESSQVTWSPLTAPVSAADSFDKFDSNLVSTTTLRSLGIPDSYSSYERTFARRLHRASCEYAYRLACDPTRIPVLFNNVFKLTLKAAGTVDRVKYSLESTLSRSTREPLSNWGVTYIHVGGAGTHYARPPEEGGLSYQSPTSWAVTTVGPHRIGGSTIEEALTAEMLLRGVAGMDGEWFDAYDVEGYLAEKGIHLDPGLTYAEIDLPDDGSSGPEEPSTASSSLDAMTSRVQVLTASNPVVNASGYFPGLANPGYTPPITDSHPHRRSDPALQTQFEPYMPVRRSTAPMLGQQFGSDIPIPGDMYSYTFQPSRKSRVTIDVGEFVKQMSLAGTCLMRAPGYRRKDIDVALRKAIVQVH